ncbi:MAG: EAL domain-containing protein [Burkholderiaceae bacterium]|nr:EAL domain-containing protein [Burkholderiaceae bacterium]
MTADDDLMVFADELGEGLPPAATAAADGAPPWKLLIVDDDEDIHQATELAMRGLVIAGRPLQFLHARSAAEARAILAEQADVAVMLLDVVMESGDAGLRLVDEARGPLGRQALRIILRTGQPGYAPEIDTIRRHDINDYRTKSELTRVRLYTSLTAALRSYRQILVLEQARRGLEMVVTATAELNRLQGLQRFAQGIVLQLCALLDLPAEGLLCAQQGGSGHDDAAPTLIAAAGRWTPLINRPLHELPDAPLRQALGEALATRRHRLQPPLALFFASADGRGVAAHVQSPRSLDALDEHLIEIFCANMAVGFDNQLLLQRLGELAYEDPLLHIANRNRFIAAVDAQQRLAEGGTLAALDIDDFAGINQNLGHAFGDRLLAAVAQRLGQQLPPPVTLARLGGDTFGLVGPAQALSAERLAALSEPAFEVDGERLRISLTAGLVQLPPAPSDGSSLGAELIKDAYIALRQAKQRRRGGACWFEPAMGAQADERMRLLRALREAFDEQRLFVAYQPLVALDTQRVIGVEALLRWRTPAGQLVPPDRFIPLAEQSGLILPIGEYVLRSACQMLARLRAAGHDGLRMSVNVSQAQFRDAGLTRRLDAALADAGVPAQQLELEITESMASESLQTVQTVLAAVRQRGVGIAIDDFGTGYSSLAVLRQLHPDRLKLDRSFVGELVAPGDGAIARTVIALARHLGLAVIAEGVETEAQRQALLELGCPEGQGWLWAPAMEGQLLLEWLASR